MSRIPLPFVQGFGRRQVDQELQSDGTLLPHAFAHHGELVQQRAVDGDDRLNQAVGREDTDGHRIELHIDARAIESRVLLFHDRELSQKRLRAVG